MTTEKQTAASSAIEYIGCTVEKHGSETYWNRVGVAFKQHKDGEGFTTKFFKGIAVSGEVVWRKPKPEEAQPPATGSDDEIPF